MSQIMVRKGRDDFEAYLTAQSMENAGAEVISIAYDGKHQQYGAMVPCSKFTIWARLPDKITIDAVDHAIEKTIDDPSSLEK